MNLPITVDLQVQTNKIDFTIQSLNIPTYPLYVDEPITVDLQVDNSKKIFAMALESNQHILELSSATAIIVGGDAPVYEGDYIILPKANSERVLQTRNKLCRDNITVTRIQTAETHNTYGTTFYIAEVE